MPHMSWAHSARPSLAANFIGATSQRKIETRCGRSQESEMKKTLLATVAAAAVVGFTTMASAQNAMDSKGAAKPAGAAEQKSAAPGGSGGAMTHQQPSAQAPSPATQGAA